jgi:hypothetical protein
VGQQLFSSLVFVVIVHEVLSRFEFVIGFRKNYEALTLGT